MIAVIKFQEIYGLFMKMITLEKILTKIVLVIFNNKYI